MHLPSGPGLFTGPVGAKDTGVGAAAWQPFGCTFWAGIGCSPLEFSAIGQRDAKSQGAGIFSSVDAAFPGPGCVG